MGLLRTCLVAGWIVACASAAHARGMSVRVCNQGQINVNVVAAYEEWGMVSSDWTVDGWFTVSPGQCALVYESSYVCDDNVRFWSPCARVRLAYWFRDPTGVWGTPNLTYPDYPPGNEKICVWNGRIGEPHRRSPDAGCNKAGWFLVPAVAKIDTYEGNGPYRPMADFQGTTLNIALTRRDLARPAPGNPDARSQSAAPAAPAAPTAPTQAAAPVTPAPAETPLPASSRLEFIVGDALREPDLARARIKTGGRSIDRMLLQICIAPSAQRASSWTDKTSAQATALAGAIRQFLGTHWFRELGSAATDSRSSSEGKVVRAIRLTEANGTFMVEELTQLCPDSEFNVVGNVPVAR